MLGGASSGNSLGSSAADCGKHDDPGLTKPAPIGLAFSPAPFKAHSVENI
jgi:hypothetical protein